MDTKTCDIELEPNRIPFNNNSGRYVTNLCVQCSELARNLRRIFGTLKTGNTYNAYGFVEYFK